jgi:gas vesicle protein
VLENSNKELRKQLIKMIEQEERLRKDLVAERIKAKTKSISSINSRNHMSSSKRLREEFGEENQPNSYLEGRLNRSMRYNSMSQSSLRGIGPIKGQG